MVSVFFSRLGTCDARWDRSCGIVEKTSVHSGQVYGPLVVLVSDALDFCFFPDILDQKKLRSIEYINVMVIMIIIILINIVF